MCLNVHLKDHGLTSEDVSKVYTFNKGSLVRAPTHELLSHKLWEFTTIASVTDKDNFDCWSENQELMMCATNLTQYEKRHTLKYKTSSSGFYYTVGSIGTCFVDDDSGNVARFELVQGDNEEIFWSLHLYDSDSDIFVQAHLPKGNYKYYARQLRLMSDFIMNHLE